MKGLKISNQRICYDIVLIGAGANGSHFFRSLLQDLVGFQSSYDFSFRVTIVDEDKVETKNLSNQLFAKEDVGEFKVQALADRYGLHYHVGVQTVARYITNMEMLSSLFTITDQDVQPSTKIMRVLVGCVDNNSTRQLMHRFFYSADVEDLIYVDLGVEGVTLRSEGLNISERMAEKEMIDASGFSGQIVTGYKQAGEVFLPPVGDVYRNILSTEDRFPGQSCGDAIVDNPQRCATNKLAAQLANGIMIGLFHTNQLFTHVIDFNAQFSGSQPHFISDAIIQKHDEFFNKTKIKTKTMVNL